MTQPSRSPFQQGQKAPSRLSRRGFVLGGVLIAGGGVLAARWFNVAASTGDAALTAPQAHAAALSGEITLIDIRRPDEWASTGVPEGGVALDMRRKDFVEALAAEVAGRLDAPIALICARGVRSNRLATRMTQAGFTRILDVPEGMLGSGAGPGWVKRGLPVVTIDT
ncbi:rhodanese-like domain-containing protein [Sulfitobacter aestuariivivens]|uniref:Rhodanese-like domain-containing protein n=1 Tax=Sulfitobacter aestuariivivens TaxID=2766981 RepID=A0A927D2Y2_9RHOB|nr:rhodanese-like domain-containing protein [Sulfitobacter aestuariivivens]MBD3662307.1 rhodanese-like domain-containing protein [Sulfitobacter aestuariivivens]